MAESARVRKQENYQCTDKGKKSRRKGPTLVEDALKNLLVK